MSRPHICLPCGPELRCGLEIVRSPAAVTLLLPVARCKGRFTSLSPKAWTGWLAVQQEMHAWAQMGFLN